MTWNFLMNTYVPGTEMTFGVFFVGFAMVDIGFSFLSLALGCNVGDMPFVPFRGYMGSDFKGNIIYGEPPRRIHISDGRKNDVR